MGHSRARKQPIHICIYCGATDGLSREHVIPYGLNGNLVLEKASCPRCAKITGSLEQRLLRGPWWPYRRVLGLQSRTPKEQPNDFPAILRCANGRAIPVRVRAEDYPCVTIFDFDPPSILSGVNRQDEPCAGRVFTKMLAPIPATVIADNTTVQVLPEDKLEFPVNLDAADFVRFLAKVGLSYAISRRGINSMREVFVRDIILGNGNGALTYVGCEKSPLSSGELPQHGTHALEEKVRGDLLSVYVQLFRIGGPHMPVYEIVVGRLAPTC